MFTLLGNLLYQFFTASADFLLEPEPGSRPRWLTWGWLAGLYLTGLLLWGIFFNFGNFRYEWQDWAEISIPRIAFVKDAITKGVLPLHMADASALRNLTDRYMALPDVILAPQMVLLRVMSVTTFVQVNTWLLYTLGFLGLLWYWRKYHLSPLAFTVIFLLFNFNGHITGHLSVGHANFVGYFLFPWLLAMLIQVLESTPEHKPGWGWIAGFAFLMFYMYLNGSFHQFVWWLMFVGLVGLFSWKHFPFLLKALLFTCLLSLFRMLPPLLYLGKFDSDFLGGYPSLYDAWLSLVSLRDPYAFQSLRSLLTQLAWWEFDLYVGLAGAIVLIFFGVYRWLKRRGEPQSYPELLIPSALLVIFSMGQVYDVVRYLSIPLLNGERVSSRLIILPFVVVLLMAAIPLHDWLDGLRRKHLVLQWALVGAVLLLANDLWQHLKVWRVNAASYAFPEAKVDLAIKVVGNHPDPAYTNLLLIGGAVTLLTAVFLVVMAVLEKRKQKA